MSDPYLLPSLLLDLLPLSLSFMNFSRSPPCTLFHSSMPLLMPFLLFGMLFLLAILAILFSRKFSLASTHPAHVPPTLIGLFVFILLIIN
mgnify:CR=1 FL=1